MRSMIASDEEIMDASSRRCHIIVGGGSSGIMLCHQLLEKDDVILIERGSKNPYAASHSTKVPSSWPVAAIYEADASRSSTMPQEALGNRILLYPQGSGVGGTSNINAMIWSAGHPAVFNNYWPKKWNSEAINSSFELVRSLFNPKKNHSPLLVQMANNSGCSCLVDDLSDTPSVPRNTEVASIFEDQLIWDTEPIKTEYLSTVGYDNKRVDISQLLYQKRINADDQDTDNKTDIKSTSRGKLTILEYCTTESIVFESISDPTSSASSIGLPVDEVDADKSALSSREAHTGSSLKGSNSDTTPKLTAIAVMCFKSKDRNSGTFLVKPLGGGEIILCAGAFESPRILLSSGLGSADNSQSAMFDSSSAEKIIGVIKKKGMGAENDTTRSSDVQVTAAAAATATADMLPIRTKGDNEQQQQPQSTSTARPVYLPGIGRNLQDHSIMPIMCVGKWWGHESALTALKERLRKIILEECSGSAMDDTLKKERTVRGTSVPSSSTSSSTSTSSLSSAVTFGALGVTMIAGILPFISSAESWVKIPRSIPELKSALKGILFAPSPPSTTQFLLLIIFIPSLVVVLLCIYMSSKSNKKTERKEHGGYEYPVNCVHGYVNLDAAGNLLPKNSTHPPSIQLLLVDGSLSPECLITEMLCPRFAHTSSFSSFYMTYLRPLILYCLRGIFLIPFIRSGAGCAFGFLVCCVQPYSRGRLYPDTDSSGRTKDLSAPLIIEHGLLTDKRDLIMMMNGMKTARKLLLGRPLDDSPSTTPTSPHTGESIPPSTTSANDSKVVSKVEIVPLHCFEAVPGMLFGNTEELEGFTNYSKHVGNTYFHISGTCAMETDRHGDGGEKAAGSAMSSSSSDCDGDNMAVVDVNLRVRGVRNLRVGDASVFPRIPSSPTSATCMAVGVSLARLILEAGSQQNG